MRPVTPCMISPRRRSAIVPSLACSCNCLVTWIHVAIVTRQEAGAVGRSLADERARRAKSMTIEADRPMPRPRDAERTKAEILKAAREEFCEQGFNGARVDAIAARAKANKRLLYHYFGNKEALYSAVLLDAYQEIRRGERELSLSQYDPVEAVDRMIRFTFRHF